MFCAGISVARRRQSTKSQSHRRFCESRPPGPPVHEVVRAPVVHEVVGRRVHVAREKKSSRGKEESSRETTAARGEVAHDKESKKLGISKLPSHCAYAKMPSLVHQMPSLSKCISQMHNCWRAIFKIFDKFLECIVQLHNCWRCSNMKEIASQNIECNGPDVDTAPIQFY